MGEFFGTYSKCVGLAERVPMSSSISATFIASSGFAPRKSYVCRSAFKAFSLLAVRILFLNSSSLTLFCEMEDGLDRGGKPAVDMI